MDKETEKRVAAYIQDRSHQLALAKQCKNDPELLDYLAKHKLIDRILRFNTQDQGSDIFVKEMRMRLNEPQSSTFADQVKQKLHALHGNSPAFSQAPAANDKLFYKAITSVAASIMLAFIVWLYLPQDNAFDDPIVSTATPSIIQNRGVTTDSGTHYTIEQDNEWIELDNGITLVAKADSEFLIRNQNEIELLQGQIRTKIPHGTHAQIETRGRFFKLHNADKSQLLNDAEHEYTKPTSWIAWHQPDSISFDISASGDIQFNQNMPQAITNVPTHTSLLAHQASFQSPQDNLALANNAANSALLDATPTSQQNTAANSQVRAASQLTSNDLLLGLNGDFETGALTHWRSRPETQGYAEVTSQAAKDGNYGLYVNTQGGNVYLEVKKQSFPQGYMHNGKLFKLSMDIKRLNNNTGQTGITGRLFNNRAKPIGTAFGRWFEINEPGEWITIEKYIPGENWPASGTSFELMFFKPEEEYYIDNIKIEPVITQGNILTKYNGDIENGEIGTYIQEKVSENENNYAQIEVREEAAITGNYGIYANTYVGDMAIKVNYKALSKWRIDPDKDYIFSYDVRLKEGEVNLVHTTPSGWVHAVPGWKPMSFNFINQAVSERGMIKVRMRVPHEVIPDSGYLEINIYSKTKGIFHMDNFEFFVADEQN
ncbi:hypothetical protein C2869_05925 [Saccharobesus litoralis]|uniref:Uncharacterized protein n=1 Tax=Saccharobesus litoralis TaxID=2172099 RepID=A0A2S0VP86_9ALTE|nr:hypothetical protein [Saccharobesus litoralis]AWB66003.1 hypothetical protein C2869_05925 [Saccharobesus litoralis]